MNIIIAGCGNVGKLLASRLAAEEHNITVIDTNPDVLTGIEDEIDALTVQGDAADVEVLKAAGVEQADLLIAVTKYDEKNLLCCLIAESLCHGKTIARVGSPMYHREGAYLKHAFELELIINPAYAAARQIGRILQFPHVQRIDTFEQGNIELFHFHLNRGCPLAGKSLQEINSRYKNSILFCTVSRKDQVYIPNGSFVLAEGDDVSVTASRPIITDFFQKIGLPVGRAKDVLIAGGGRMGFYLAQDLLKSGVEVTIIEKNAERADRLASDLPEAVVIHGDVANEKLLEEEEIYNKQAFVACTNLDEENIFLSLHVMRNSKAKVITRIHRMNYSATIERLNLDTVINPQILTTGSILRYVRSQTSGRGSAVESLYVLEQGKAEAIEFRISEGFPYVGVPLHNLKFKDNVLIASIFHNGKSILPHGSDCMQIGDYVIVITSGRKITNISEIFA